MSLEIDIKMCRICMKTNDGIPIYTGSGIIKKLQFCTQLKISKTDELPKIICIECVGRLEIAYDFCKQAQCSDKYLRRVMTHHKEELNQSELGKQGLYDEMVLKFYRTRTKLEQDDQIEQLTDFESEDVSIVNISPTLEEGINCKGNERLTDSVPVYAVFGECSAADKVKIEEVEEADIEKIQETEQINLFTIAKITSIPKTEFNQTNEMTGNVSCSQEDIESLSEDKQNKVDQSDQMKQLTNVKSVKISETVEEGIQYKGSIFGADIVRIEKLQETIFTIEKVTSIRKNEDDQTGGITGKGIVPLQATKRLTDSVPMYAVAGECSAADKVKIEEIEEADIEKIQETKQLNLFTIAKVTSIPKTEFNQTNEMTGNVSCSQEDIESLSDDTHINVKRGDQLKQPTDVKSVTISDTIEEDIQYKESSCEADIAKIEKSQETTFIKAKVTSIRKNEDDQNGKFKCIKCGARFKRKWCLKRHSQIHMEKRKGSNQTDKMGCIICGVQFTTRTLLKRHSLIHSGERPYKCNSCDQSFAQKYNLISHMRRHSDGRPYTCQTCGFPFQRQSSLKRHVCNEQQNQKKAEIKINVKQRNRERSPIQNSIRKNGDEKTGNIKCTLCGAQFRTRASLKQHSLIHSGERPHKCNLCDRSFTQKSNLTSHMIRHSDEKSHTCHACGFRFKYKITLKRHVCTKNGDDKTDNIKCTLCGAQFTTSASLKQHSLIHSGERPHKCNLCDRSFTQKVTLSCHMLQHSGEKPYICETCGFTFRLQKSLDRHIFMKHDDQNKAEVRRILLKRNDQYKRWRRLMLARETPEETALRKKKLAARGRMVRYRAKQKQPTDVKSVTISDTIEEDIQYKESTCGADIVKIEKSQETTFIKAKVTSIRKNEDDQTDKFECIECGARFNRKWCLKRHSQTHLGKRSYKKKGSNQTDKMGCIICGAQFTNRTLLKRHSLIHSGERPYKCNSCDQSFAQKCNLINHMRRHSDERPYTCQTCGFPFRRQSTLKRHISTKHPNQKKAEMEINVVKQRERKRQSKQNSIRKNGDDQTDKFDCIECGAHFTQKGTLNRHSLFHSGERPYKCNICNQSFAQKSNLIMHMIRHN